MAISFWRRRIGSRLRHQVGRGFLSAVPLSEEDGDFELNVGELYRYLAEAVWYPTALLPDESLRWTATDDSRATATLSREEISAAIEFRFGSNGAVTSIYATGRSRRVNGRYERTPWEGRLSKYVEQDGMRIPIDAEVGWYVSGAWQPVWRGSMSDIKYEFAPTRHMTQV